MGRWFARASARAASYAVFQAIPAGTGFFACMQPKAKNDTASAPAAHPPMREFTLTNPPVRATQRNVGHHPPAPAGKSREGFEMSGLAAPPLPIISVSEVMT